MTLAFFFHLRLAEGSFQRSFSLHRSVVTVHYLLKE